MMNTIEFFTPMVPPTITDQEHRVIIRKGKPAFYRQAELEDARAKLMSAVYPHRPDHPMQGPVRLVERWIYPADAAHPDGTYKITKPDCDNSNKMMQDVMTKAEYWKDDSQVASLLVEKFYGNIPGIYVKAEEIAQ